MSEQAEKFKQIEDENQWNYDQEARVNNTIKLRAQLLTYIEQEGIRTIVDVPSGHFTWQEKLIVDSFSRGNPVAYTGADIVESITEKNREAYPMHKFRTLDITQDTIPAADLLIVRDCLVHYSHSGALKALENILYSRVKWIALTTFPNHIKNKDITLGGWHPQNLFLEPYSLPFPAYLLTEKHTGEGQYDDKILGIWEAQALRDAYEGREAHTLPCGCAETNQESICLECGGYIGTKYPNFTGK